MRRFFSGFVLSTLLAAGSTGYGAVVNVLTLQPTVVPNGGVWGQASQNGGTAAIVDLSGQGGNLENNQPLPTGAVRLTTTANTSDRAEIGISQDFGNAAAILNDLAMGYSYFKVAVGNLSAAPSLKLEILGPNHSMANDNFGTLIYEPNWNQGVDASVLPPSGDWQSVTIDETTGSGGTGGGGWWWSGGFGQASGAGGPPIRSAFEWAGLFAADADFADARIVGIRVGVGTFNQDQLGYFDAVVFGDTTWDFGPQAAVPEPASMALWGFGALGLACYRARRKRAASHA